MRRGLLTAQKGAMMRTQGAGSLINFQRRNFNEHLNLDSTTGLEPVEYKATDQVALWKDHLKADNALATRDNE